MKTRGKRRGGTFLFLMGLTLWLLASASACGYRVMGSEPVGEGQVRPTLAIPPFENRSMEAGLETLFANDMIQAFQDSKVVRVRSGDGTADYMLRGSIKKLEHSSTAYLDIGQSLIRRVIITVEITLTDNRHQKVIWKDAEIVKADYVADASYGIGEANRHQGIRQASVRLARRVQDKVSIFF